MGSTQLQSLNDAIIGIKIDCLPFRWSDLSRARKQLLPVLFSAPIPKLERANGRGPSRTNCYRNGNICSRDTRRKSHCICIC